MVRSQMLSRRLLSKIWLGAGVALTLSGCGWFDVGSGRNPQSCAAGELCSQGGEGDGQGTTGATSTATSNATSNATSTATSNATSTATSNQVPTNTPTNTNTPIPPTADVFELRIEAASGTEPNNSCRGGYVVQRYKNGTVTNQGTTPLVLEIDGQAAATFTFTNGNYCQGQTSFTMANGQSIASLSFKAPLGFTGYKTFRVRDTSNVYSPATLPINFYQGGGGTSAATELRVTVHQPVIEAGECTPVTIAAYANGLPTNVPSTLPLSLSFTPLDPVGTLPDNATAWHNSMNCADGTATTTSAIAADANSVTISFYSTHAGQLTLRALAGGILGVGYLTVNPSSLTKVVRWRTLATTTSAGTCEPAVVGFTDGYGNNLPTTVQTAINVEIPAIPAQTEAVMYTQANCPAASANPNRTVDVAAGNHSAVVYLKFLRTTAANTNGYELRPRATGYGPISGYVKILPASAHYLVIEGATGPVFSDFVNSCVNLVLRVSDMYGNSLKPENGVSARVAHNMGFANTWLHTGWDCQGAEPANGISQINLSIPANADSAPFSFKAQTAGPVTITANSLPSSIPLIPAQFSNPPPLMILAGDPAVISLKQPVAPVVAGTCGAKTDFLLKDAFDNDTTARAITKLRVRIYDYAYPAKIPLVYSASDCSGSSLLTIPDPSTPNVYEISIPKFATGGTLYFKHTVAEQVHVTVAGPTVVPAIGTSEERTVIVLPAPATHFAFVDAAPRGKAAECSLGIRLVALDPFGNASATNGLVTTLLSFAGPSSVQAYSNECTTLLPGGNQLSFNGESERIFYVRGAVAGNYQITASGPNGFSPPATLNFSIVAGAPVGLVIAPANGSSPTVEFTLNTAGTRMGPFVVRPVDRAYNSQGSDQNADIIIEGQKQIGRVPAADVIAYSVSGGQCTNTALANNTVNLPLLATQSAPFCLGTTIRGGKLAIPRHANFLGLPYAFQTAAAKPTKFIFRTSVNPAVGRCVFVSIEGQDPWNNPAPLITEAEDPNNEGAIVSVTANLTSATQSGLFTNRACSDLNGSGEITFPSDVSKGYVYFLSNLVSGNVPLPVTITASPIVPSLGFTNSTTITPAPGYPSVRTLTLTSSVAEHGWMAVNACYPLTMRINSQNGGANPSLVTFPGTGSAVLSIAGTYNSNAGSGPIAYLYSNASCSSGAALDIVKEFAKGEQGQYTAYMKPNGPGPFYATANTTYAGTTLLRRAFWNVTAGACNHNESRTRVVQYVPQWQFTFGAYPKVVIGEYCRFGEWIITGAYLGREPDGCFSPETRIAMAGGASKRADLVKAGDEVWNPVLRRPSRVNSVVVGAENAALVQITAGGSIAKVSTEHPMVTDRGLVRAVEVRRGDRLLKDDGRLAKVESVRRLPAVRGQKVYNFVLEVPEDAPEAARYVAGNGFVTGEWILQNNLPKTVLDGVKGTIP